MTTETLTDAEQASLASTDQSSLHGRTSAKALRIIDALTADFKVCRDERLAALQKCDALTSDLDVARATVRRLVKKDHECANQYQEYMKEADAELESVTADRDDWKARAEAAEAADVIDGDVYDAAVRARKAAESELSTLRAERAALCAQLIAVKADRATLRAENERLGTDRFNAEVKAESLRIENERLRGNAATWDELLRRAESRLSTATELLAAAAPHVPGMVFESQHRAFLANQPAAPTRTETVR